MEQTIRARLLALVDEEYRQFHSKLLPDADPTFTVSRIYEADRVE
ncbi:hypothetical protein SOV_06640 [Sporomusa ovata DSM 2662]|nr:hypothetical protein [Sporomusa ovata]EQB28323.1 hypothetical protein SOV_1c00020 [Sporomusa ovata DSM 2662]